MKTAIKKVMLVWESILFIFMQSVLIFGGLLGILCLLVEEQWTQLKDRLDSVD